MSLHRRLVGWAFTRFYREFAWTYDRVAALVSWGAWRTWALVPMPALHGQVLELGCGTGYLQQALANHGGHALAVGIDASRQMLAHTRQRVPTATLVRGSALDLPFVPQSFDCAVATFPSDYIAQPDTLHELHRVLKPGGQLLIVLGAQLDGPAVYRWLVALAYRLALLPPPTGQLPGAGGQEPESQFATAAQPMGIGAAYTTNPSPTTIAALPGQAGGQPVTSPPSHPVTKGMLPPTVERLLARMAAAGLAARAEWRPCERGMVLLITAEAV